MTDVYQQTPRCENQTCEYELVREITEFRNNQVTRVDQIRVCKKCGNGPTDPVVIWQGEEYQQATGYDPNGLSGLKQTPDEFDPEAASEHGVKI